MIQKISDWLREGMQRGSCSYDFSHHPFRVVSFEIGTGEDELKLMCHELAREIIASCNIINHEPVMITNYINSCRHSFGAVRRVEDGEETFVSKATSTRISFKRRTVGQQRVLDMLVNNSSGDEIFITMEDTIGADRIWNLALRFPENNED